MAKALVLYASKNGQTRKIAEFIGEELRQAGNFVEVADVASAPPRTHIIQSFDAIVVGGPVYAGKFPAPLVEWVKKFEPTLSRKPSMFFSVCLGILETNNFATQKKEREIVKNFLDATGWRPSLWRIFAGSLAYTQYGWLTRWIMKRIAKKAGGSVDTSKDHEYTDWGAVAKAARDLCEILTDKKQFELRQAAP